MSLADQQWCPTSIQVTVLQARGLRIKGKSGTNDAYAVMQVGKEKYQTSVVEKSVAPVWKEEAAFDLPHQGVGGGGGERGTLHVHVLHRALVGPDKLLGQAVINLLQLSEDKTRNKTEWFKLLDKTGKADKDRGEVLLDIQFMRNNMTASMFDLSAAGKSRSRLGKFKDKVRGKKKESDSVSSVVPSFSQVLTDSEEEANGDAELAAGKDEKKKKQHKMKSLFSPKSNLQKNMSQSMSVLPAKNSSLSGSQSSGLNVDSSEGKKKFKFMIHKRSGSSDNKDSSCGHQKHGPVEQSNLCINGSHVYCEEPQPWTSRIGSNFSLASSGHGSMEDVPESSPPSVDSLRAVRQYSPWTEEEEEEEETAEVDNKMEDVDELRGEEEERIRMEEERRRKEEEEEHERLAEEKRRQERRRIEEEEKRKIEEEERIRAEEDRAQEERRRQEEERKRAEKEEQVRREEEERTRREEERKRQEEEERVRKEEEELERLAEEKRRLEEEERRRNEEEEKRKREEEERIRAEEERAQEERRRQEKERARRQEEERKLAEEKWREEEERRIEEEKVRKQEEERIRREEERAEEERRRKEEEERMRRQEEEYEEKRRLEEQERKLQEEEKRIRREEERKKQEEEERVRREEECERLAAEMRRLEEQERRRIEEKRQREEEERIRVAEERAQEECRRQEEEERARKEKEDYERLVKEKRKLEEKEKERVEAEEKIRREEEERIRVEEERKKVEEPEKVRREEEEREEKRRLEEQERRRVEEEEKRQREKLERIRKEEERRQEEENRAKKEKEEYERLVEEKRRLEEQERRQREEEERIKNEEQERIRIEEEKRRRQEEKENAKKEKEEMERLAEEKRKLEEQKKRRIEEEEKIKREEEESIRRLEKAERERKEKEARKLEDEKLMTDAEERKERENKAKVGSPAEVPSTNPFDEDTLNNPFEDIPNSPAGPDSSTAKGSNVQPGCQFAVSSMGSKTISTTEKDLISAQREKRPAPQPPGRNEAESQREQDASIRHLAQMNKQSNEKVVVKTASVPPQRSLQMIAPQSHSHTDTKNTQGLMQSSATKETESVAKHSKRPAPPRPRSVEEEASPQPKTPSFSAGHISQGRGSERKQVPAVYGLNPFEDDEDENELTAQDDTTTPGSTGTAHWPAAVSRATDKDATSQAKVKSSKMAHAPPPPAKTAATSSSLIHQKTDRSHVMGDTGVAVSDKGGNQACDPQLEATISVSVQEASLKEPQPAIAQRAGGQAGVNKEVPPTTSRRLQPVKPLNPLEQQSVSIVQGEKHNKSTGVLGEVQEKPKVNDSRPKGPYSQLTREELISLVLKQENQLSEKDKKISELEQYIDNLLVRVIEEKPSILMSMSSLKKAV